MKTTGKDNTLFLQALISVAIFGAITASIVRLLQMQNNLSIKTTEEFETVYFISEIRNVLSNPNACKASFLDKRPQNDRSSREIFQYITDENNNSYTFPVFEKGQVFKNTDDYSLKLKEIFLLQHDKEVRVQAGTTGLHFSIEFFNKKNNRIKVLERTIKLFVTVDSDQKIKTCYTLRGLGLGKEITGRPDQFVRKSDNSGHFISNKKLLVNTSNDNAELNIGGAMRLESVEIDCSEKISNSLRYNGRVNKFEMCDSNLKRWIDVNSTSPFSNEKTKLMVSLPLKYSSTRKAFKTCSIVKIDPQSSTCQLDRLEDSRWQIHLENARSRYASCEATCNN